MRAPLHRSGRTRLLAPARALVLSLVLTAGLAGCGSGEDESTTPTTSTSSSSTVSASPDTEATASATPTPTAEPSAPPYLPVPEGVALTEQGTDLTLAQPATVAWQPRQQVTGVLDLTVDRVERTSIQRSFSGWQIPAGTETSTPYFVRATVTNRGETDLGGRRVPLYVLNDNGTLIEATSFASTYRPCRRGAFPEPFAPGATTSVCLVYLAPEQGGALAGVTFRPTEEFDPITWTGEVRRLGQGGNGGRSGGGQGGGGEDGAQ